MPHRTNTRPYLLPSMQLGGSMGGGVIGGLTTGSWDGTLAGANVGMLLGGIGAGVYNLLRPCFAAGTPIRTAEGSKPIEEIVAGDHVLSRDENDPEGPVLLKVVEETFVRTGRIWVLRIDGRDIRTTGEHPFYARGKGWTAVADLDTTDVQLSEDGRWLPIEALEDTGEYETVYNFRVADFRTCFIGGDGWTWSVWTHNLCTNLVHDAATGNTTLELVNKFASNTPEYRQLVRFVKAWNSQITKLGGSMTRRTESSIEKLASAVWKKAMRKAYPKRFAGKVVGHTPDAAAGGPSSPTTANGYHIKAMALRKSVNAYLGGILSGIPVGTTYHAVKLV